MIWSDERRRGTAALPALRELELAFELELELFVSVAELVPSPNSDIGLSPRSSEEDWDVLCAGAGVNGDCACTAAPRVANAPTIITALQKGRKPLLERSTDAYWL